MPKLIHNLCQGWVASFVPPEVDWNFKKVCFRILSSLKETLQASNSNPRPLPLIPAIIPPTTAPKHSSFWIITHFWCLLGHQQSQEQTLWELKWELNGSLSNHLENHEWVSWTHLCFSTFQPIVMTMSYYCPSLFLCIYQQSLSMQWSSQTKHKGCNPLRSFLIQWMGDADE